ncbi:MAG: FGGY family carbohydrate kinase [Oscillospiraceae bacterium]
MIVDIGTGNTRAGVALANGDCISVSTVETSYYNDDLYPDATTFSPTEMWENVLKVSKDVLSRAKDVKIKAITATSGRQGIVLIDNQMTPYLGLPNIDNRGMDYEGCFNDFDSYIKAGRWANRYFSAYKLVGLREKRRCDYERIHKITSISDFIGFMLTGNLCYEPSQACETLLFNTEKGSWSPELCKTYGIDMKILPNVLESGTKLGTVKDFIADELGLDKDVPFIVGGSDTSVAVVGTHAVQGEIVVTSGTTTPITFISDEYVVDSNQKCWTNCHLEKGKFILESNVGVTGLNYQRLKKSFAPNISYKQLEDDMNLEKEPRCICSLSTIKFEENRPLLNGAFVFNTPVESDLGVSDFALASLADMACGIKSNIDNLISIKEFKKDYIVCCGGGFNGDIFPQLVADFTEKTVVLRHNYSQSSIVGCVNVCNEYFKTPPTINKEVRKYIPKPREWKKDYYKKWAEFREIINK